MDIAELILYLLAVIAFAAAAFGAASPRLNLMALGLALAFTVPLIHAIQALD